MRDETRLAELRRVHERLHQQLAGIVAADPLVREAVQGSDGGLIVAVRSSFVQDVLREAARAYLDDVVVDLGSLETSAQGEIRGKTLLGRVTVGRWRLDVEVKRLRVRLRAGTPRLRVVGAAELALQVPVEAMEAPGRVALRFSWDSASIANLVCRDFDLARELDGRTLEQHHTIAGTFRLSAGPDAVVLEPTVGEQFVKMKMDLTPASWTAVDEALRTQDSLTKCGLLLDRTDVSRRLRDLASQGIKVKLPREMLRRLRLPGSFQRTAQIEGRPVEVAFRTRSFEATEPLMWSRAAVAIESARRPAGPRVGSMEAARDLSLLEH